MATIKYSRQRESIKHFLAGRTDHPTADTVYQNIRRTFPNISLGTVYRNLSLLTELGEIQKLNTGDGAERFDYNTAPHDHFVCRECHGVFDMEATGADQNIAAAQAEFPGLIESCHTIFYGVCEQCLHTPIR